MNKIAVLVPEITSRLSYTLDWILVQQLGVDYSLCTEKPVTENGILLISYGTDAGMMNIPSCGLLFENNVRSQQINSGKWKELPTLFDQPQAKSDLPFDLFAAVFYLISRYEEYLPFSPDKHLRFPATESILFQLGLLSRPIVDEWIMSFGKLLQSKGIEISTKPFEFLPTYDIDIAWSYKHKGLKRNLGGYLRDGNNFSAIHERTSVLLGQQKDPFDSFEFMDELHTVHKLHPIYFILSAQRNTPFDKNILPSHRAMRELIASLATRYKIGMHPSYLSKDQPELFAGEQKLLAQLAASEITKSRQHYIRLHLPDTYRHLIACGIQQDYSMGYGTHLGFRAGTSRSFYWYDLMNEIQTELEVFPFCFMDTTAHYELQLSTAESFEQLMDLKNMLKAVHGLLITVFHNFSLGSAAEWKGWSEQYSTFIKQA